MSVQSIEVPQINNGKYFRQIGANMVGNQLVVSMEKNKFKSVKKKRSQWDPPCDCIEIRRPSGNEGPRIVNGGDNNQILFRINSKGHLNKKFDPNYKPQAIAYEVKNFHSF